MEKFDLQDRDNRRQQEEQQQEREEETDFGGGETEENNLLDKPDWLSSRGRVNIAINHLDPLKKLFRNRVYEARNIGFFIKDVLLMEKEECTNPRFINYLMEKQVFSIKKNIKRI